MDLATGHVAALTALYKKHMRLRIYNLGTGKGVSVLKLVKIFEKVTGTTVPYVIKERREGDITSMFADTTLAEEELGWKAKFDVEQMCKCFHYFLYSASIPEFDLMFCFLKQSCFYHFFLNLGEDFWRWQSMNPHGYRSCVKNGNSEK